MDSSPLVVVHEGALMTVTASSGYDEAPAGESALSASIASPCATVAVFDLGADFCADTSPFRLLFGAG